jgi:hypothetical protein
LEGLRAYKQKLAFRQRAKLYKKRHFSGWYEIGNLSDNAADSGKEIQAAE